MSELKRRPFCGCLATEGSGLDGGFQWYFVECMDVWILAGYASDVKAGYERSDDY